MSLGENLGKALMYLGEGAQNFAKDNMRSMELQKVLQDAMDSGGITEATLAKTRNPELVADLMEKMSRNYYYSTVMPGKLGLDLSKQQSLDMRELSEFYDTQIVELKKKRALLKKDNIEGKQYIDNAILDLQQKKNDAILNFQNTSYRLPGIPTPVNRSPRPTPGRQGKAWHDISLTPNTGTAVTETIQPSTPATQPNWWETQAQGVKKALSDFIKPSPKKVTLPKLKPSVIDVQFNSEGYLEKAN